MRLRQIIIKEYRALKDFTLDCIGEAEAEKFYTLHLIVGVNGTGKSTLLRLLARLFLQLKNEQQRNPPFGFEVSYQLNKDDKIISITNLNETGNLVSGNQGLRIRYEDKDGVQNDYETFDALQHSDDLPPRVIAFTTGNEEEWIEALQLEDQPDSDSDEELKFPNPQQPGYQEVLKEWYLQELPGSPVEDTETIGVQKSEGIRTDYFYFLSAQQIPLVTLCGMLVDMNDAQNSSTTGQSYEWINLLNVMQEAKIKALRGFSLRLRMNKETLIEPDKGFIRKLIKLATHTVQIGSDYLLAFDLLKKRMLPNDLLALVGGKGFLFFSSLARLAQVREPDERLLQEVNLFLERSKDQEQQGEQGISADEDNQPPLHLFKWLSDGEQSFLGRLCLMPLLRDSEALILLDEPEVHFNDYWKQQLVLMLDESLKMPQSRSDFQPSHILMTTHSSITLTDVVNTNILLLKRSNGYTYETIPTSLETLGADPSDIIVSIFGAPHAAGAGGVKRIKRELDRIRSIAAEGQQLPENIKNQCIKDLGNLEKQVGPGYWRFLILRTMHDLRGR